MNWLKNHPFAVDAFFESSVVLTFAVPKEQLQTFIPSCLSLETFQEKWAFLAVAMVQTKNLRPEGFPTFLGNNFFLIGYRIFVRFTDPFGKIFRGLYILKSETDKLKMEFLGNIFTHYSYTTTDITDISKENTRIITSKKSNIYVTIDYTDETIPLPKNSPFQTWTDAKKFAGPLPFTFSYNTQNNTILIIEGKRAFWKPKPLQISHYEIGYIQHLQLHDVVLANAFEVKNIPYAWKKGRIQDLNN